ALSGTGLLAHGYRGTVAFFATDAAATLPEPYRFGPEDYGIASFPGEVTLVTPGTQVLVAFDLETVTIIGYPVIEVSAGRGSGGPDLFATHDLLRGPSSPAFDALLAELEIQRWVTGRKKG